MEIVSFFLAEGISQADDGRFSVRTGGIRGYVVGELPAQLPSTLSLMVHLRLKREEVGVEQTIHLVIISPDKIPQDKVIRYTPECPVDKWFPDREILTYVVLTFDSVWVHAEGLHDIGFISGGVTAQLDLGIKLAAKDPVTPESVR